MIKDNNVETILENIKSYFETYVKTYQPYKDNSIFKSILDTLIDYLKELYVEVPTNLLDLVVKNVITPRTNIDYLLFEIGLPEDLIHKLSNMEKWLFFEVLSDFTRYKSTVNFFKILCGSAETTFTDKFTLYELWIDRTSNGNWVLKPVVIYRGKYSNVTTDPIPYDAAYQKIPSLLISKDQLEAWYQNNQIILPFKSNIILLGQYEITNISYLCGLIRATFFKHYKNTDVALYFNDNKKFVIKLSTVDKLWHYLVYKYYNFSQSQNVFNDILLFSEDNSNVPDISQLDNIIDQFVNINSWDEYYQFINTYISPFHVDMYSQENFTVEKYHDILTNESPLFMSYIDERLRSCVEQKNEIIYLLDEIYGSLIVSLTDYANDEYYIKYLPAYLETLNKIFVPDIDIQNPKTYTSKITLTLKPFHTEVLLDTYKKIQVEDREFFDDVYLLAMEVNKASVFDISAWEFLTQFRFSVCSSIPVISVIPTFMSLIFETISYKHLIRWLNSLRFTSVNTSSDTDYNIFFKNINSSQPIISAFNITPVCALKTDYDIIEKEYWKLTQLFGSIRVVSDAKNTVVSFFMLENFPDIREIFFPMVSSSDQFFSYLYFDLYNYNDYLVAQTLVKTLYNINDNLFGSKAGFYIPYNINIHYLVHQLSTLFTDYFVNDNVFPISRYITASIVRSSDDRFIIPIHISYIPFNLTEQYFLHHLYFALYTNYVVHELITYNFLVYSSNHIEDIVANIGAGYFVSLNLNDKFINKKFTDNYKLTYSINEEIISNIYENDTDQIVIDDSQYSTSINY